MLIDVPAKPRCQILASRIALLMGWAVAGLLSAAVAMAQPAGLAAPQPVGAFLNGVLPLRTPNLTGGATFLVADAFPSVPIMDALVIATNPDETNPASDRLYVGRRDGRIVSYLNDPSATTTDPFLDLRDRVHVVFDGGFLNLLFHKDFGIPGAPGERAFFVFYTSNCPLDAGLLQTDLAACDPTVPTTLVNGFFGAYLRLSRYEVFDAQAPVLVGDPASEVAMLNLRLMNSSHRGGGMAFANDGMFLVTIGDQFTSTTAQTIDDNIQGGVIRLAVDLVPDGQGGFSCPAGSHLPVRLLQNVSANADEISGQRYCIPDDNPFLGLAGTFGEYFTIGHRNPHRLSVDRTTGRIWSAEVGEDTREEVNVLLGGGNYGWPFREGLVPGLLPPPATIIGTVTDPVIDYTRLEARAIIGGYVYRGTEFPELVGKYIAGDYVLGNLWAITFDPATSTATSEVIGQFTPGGLATFGEDNQGELFLGSVTSTIPLQKLVRQTPPPSDAPALLSALGVFDDLPTLDPADFFVPYEPVPFWSDGALKQRFIALPNDGTHDQPDEQIVWDATGNWGYPIGTVLMKHFDLGLDETDPSNTTPLETRFQVHGDDGVWYGLTYKWRSDRSDADLLLADDTETFQIALAGGGMRSQTWTYPARSTCLSCHEPGPGFILGPRAHALNRDLTYPATGITDNQLHTWNFLGMFDVPVSDAMIQALLPAPLFTDVTASLEDRSRSWIDANCAYCHQPATGNRAAFDARFTTLFPNQGLVGGPVLNDLGIPGAAIVVPGDPMSSILFQRASALGPIAMPPLAKTLVHQIGVDVSYEWITRIDPAFASAGLTYELYNDIGSALLQLPDLSLEVLTETGVSSDFDISPGFPDDDKALRFFGYVEVPVSGDWTFHLDSNDGSQLLLDGGLLVDADGAFSQQASGLAAGLAAGAHAIEVLYFQRGGVEFLNVEWEGPGVVRQPIPPTALFLTPPGNVVNGAPVLTTPSDRAHTTGNTVAIPVVVADPDGNSVYVEASGLPAGITYQAGSQQLEGTLPVGSEGVYTVTLGASDGPLVDSGTFAWTVTAAQCSNGVDDDGDSLIDWDGGGVGLGDLGCQGPLDNTEASAPVVSCGLGAEVALAIGCLHWLRRRRGLRRVAQEALA